MLTSQDLYSTLQFCERKVQPFQTSMREINTRAVNATDRDDFLSAVKRRRVEAAINLLTWTSILWNSAWARNICACSLYQSIDGAKEAVFGMLPEAEEEPRQCSLCTSIISLNNPGNMASGPEWRASPEDEVDNLRIVIRVVCTLCEIALCEPVHTVTENGYWPHFHYNDRTNNKKDLLRDIRLRCEGRYANVVKKLLQVVDNPEVRAAPLDVVCNHLERARVDLALFHREYLCSRERQEAETRQWSLENQKKARRIEFPQWSI